jgi:hypothetical protein
VLHQQTSSAEIPPPRGPQMHVKGGGGGGLSVKISAGIAENCRGGPRNAEVQAAGAGCQSEGGSR